MPEPEPGRTETTRQQTTGGYRCTACNQDFNSNTELENHNRTMHK